MAYSGNMTAASLYSICALNRAEFKQWSRTFQSVSDSISAFQTFGLTS
jgi:hypothetical protein